ncbi:acyltransferase family protein [Rhizorhabdus argentea]|uniref:acyltransferase family protein n=1 Tax=Rhizorhabdus argentea TaxID=1387174 RepID=UPI0030EB2F8A
MGTSSTTYRSDIDGLRAISIVPVVFYHVGVGGFSGGFVGVDIFFVISGYLITSLIVSEVAQSRFSMISFYDRRARRILPALFAVIATTCVAASFILLPNDFKDFGQSVAGTALFGANILFALEQGGYFVSDAKPLLHMWSLCVEEQFYIFWPILLIISTRLRWNIPAVIGVVCVMSFAASVWATAAHPVPAFYLAPFRAWELGLGALLATGAVPETRSTMLRELGSIAGVALIAFTVFSYSGATKFPGLNAVPPCLGAALLIHNGKQPTLVRRVLSLSPFVFIGLVSYSLYLWHWPIIVLYRYATNDYISASASVAIIAASGLLAVLSWRFVEKPFRQHRQQEWRIGTKSVFAASGASIAAAVMFGSLVHLGNGWWWRLPAPVAAMDRAALKEAWPECLVDSGSGWNEGSKPCVRGSKGPVRTALWGDSHAWALLPGVAAAADRAGERVIFYGSGGCPPAIGIERTDGVRQHICNAYNMWALRQLVSDREIHTVVLASRLQAYVEHSNYGPSEEHSTEPAFATAGGEPPGPASDLVLAAMARTIARLRAVGKHVAIVYPVPEIGTNVPNRLTQLAIRGGQLDGVYLDARTYARRTRRTRIFLDGIAGGVDLQRIRPSENLCDADRCMVVKDGVSLYRDDDHLSIAGAIGLSRLFDGVFSGRPDDFGTKMQVRTASNRLLEGEAWRLDAITTRLLAHPKLRSGD